MLREYNEIKEVTKYLKMLWNITQKNNGNRLCQIQENSANKSSSVRRTKQNKLVSALNCGSFCKKKSRFIKNQESGGLLSKLGTKTLISDIPLLLFQG